MTSHAPDDTTLNHQQTSTCTAPTILHRVPATVEQIIHYSSAFNNALPTTVCVAGFIPNS